MKKKVLFLSTILTTTVLILLFTHHPARAMIELMDGKLKINGFIKETMYLRTQMQDREKHGPGGNHDSILDYANTAVMIEALYTLKDDDDMAVRLFGGLRWWWEKAPLYDDDLRRSIAHRDRKDYVHPRNFDDDMLTELYIDIQRGPWQIVIGKQIVQWGQLDVNRVADVVNPLDLRHGVPGVDAWEEIKQGIWMIRTFYQSELPGNLLFEFIFNPGDYRGTLLPYQSTHWGPRYFKNAQFKPGHEMGMFAWLHQKMNRDHHGWNLGENYEFGGRISGYTWDIDWTLLYWNHKSDGAVTADPAAVSALATQYVTAGLKSMFLGGSVNPGDWPSTRVFKYKRYQTIGGTAQTQIDWLRYTTWDLEWFYEIDTPLSKGERGSSQALYDEVRRDILGIAIKVSDRIRLPKWFNNTFRTQKKLEISLTYFWEKVFNHDHDLVLDDRKHRPRDNITDAVSLFLRQELWHTSWNLVFIGNYYFQVGHWMAVPVFTYVFPSDFLGGGMRVDIGAKFYGRQKHKIIGNDYDKKDSIILRLRYEF